MGIFDRNTETIQKDRLEELCQIIDLSFKQFRKAGQALKEIRDEALYRYSHETFAAFCRERWQITEAHASRLINAHTVCELLGPAGELIENERQARQVKQLDDAQRSQLAIDITTNRTPIVEALRKHLPTGKKSPKKIKPIRIRVPGGTVIIEPNKRFTNVPDIIEQVLRKLEAQKNAA